MLRVMWRLALQDDCRSNLSEIVERHRMSRNHLVKIVRGLARAGLI